MAKRRQRFLRHFREKSVYRFLMRMPTSLHYLYGVSRDQVTGLVRYWVITYENWVINRGEVDAVKVLKDLHGVALRYAANSTFEPIDYIAKDENGIPSLLGPFLPLLQGTIMERRAAILILALFKLVLAKGDFPPTSSITDPFQIPIEYEFRNQGEFYYRVERFFQTDRRIKPGTESRHFNGVLEEMFPKKDWFRRLRQIRRYVGLHVSPRNGPNGPAIASSLADLQAVHQFPSLFDSIKQLAELTKHQDLLDLLNTFPPGSYNLPVNSDGNQPLHSRLSLKIEAGAKTRLFAIVDYFTQSVLKCFHKWIFKYLSVLPEDGTSSQDRVCQIVKNWTINALDNGLDVFSTDLSKATDRLPSYLQFEIVRQIAGSRFASLWYIIISQRDFRLPNSADQVRFNCGQPLGAYSSWAMLALTHNIICRHALARIGKEYSSSNPSFVIVGDDNALIGSDFEQSYHHVMVTLCRLSVSPLKGFSPLTVSNLNPLPGPIIKSSVAEFCKRVFYNGEELSTLSPVTLKESLEYPLGFPSLISDNAKRGITLSWEGLGALAWLNFNPDQAITISVFPLTSALESTILQEAKLYASELKLEWYKEEFIPYLEPLYFGTLLENVRSGVLEFAGQISKFRDTFNETRKVRSWSFDCPSFYNILLRRITDTMAYDTAKMVDRLRSKKVDIDIAKKLADGLIDLEDLSESFFLKKNKPDDRPKRLSRRIASLTSQIHKVLKGENPQALEIYRYYKNEIDTSSLEALSRIRDVAFVEVDDDWELVIPINFEGNLESDDFQVDEFSEFTDL